MGEAQKKTAKKPEQSDRNSPEKTPEQDNKPDSAPDTKPRLRRYWFDTEFRDGEAKGKPLSFISIGIINEDDEEYYAVYQGVKMREYGRDPWLKENVLDKLPPRKEWKTLKQIKQEVLDMIEPAHTVEFWARNGTYDNYILCRMFGGMGGLRKVLKEEKGVEKVRFRDMIELNKAFGRAAVKRMDKKDEHIAVNDARQDKKEFDYYKKIRKTKKPKPPI